MVYSKQKPTANVSLHVQLMSLIRITKPNKIQRLSYKSFIALNRVHTLNLPELFIVNTHDADGVLFEQFVKWNHFTKQKIIDRSYHFLKLVSSYIQKCQKPFITSLRINPVIQMGSVNLMELKWLKQDFKRKAQYLPK